MKCVNCEYEKVCNNLLRAQVKLGLFKCKQGRMKRMVKKRETAAVTGTDNKVETV